MDFRSCGSSLIYPARQLRAQPRHLATFVKPNLHIAHFRQGGPLDLQGSVVRLPVEGQELLGLRKSEVVKDSELNTVYEQLVGAATEAGYSENVLNGRLEVLDYVRRDIISSKGRARDSRELNLPVDLLPGALALMTEVGQCQLALDIGAELLRNSSPDSPLTPALRRDVILSMALANCGLASESLEGKSAQDVGQGCSYLEAALQQLEGAGEPPLAPELAAEIRQGLAALKFQSAVEQLSAPLNPSKAEARKRALRTIRDAIRAQSQQGATGQSQPGDALGPLSGLGLGLAVGQRVSGAAAAATASAASAGGPAAGSAGAAGAGATVTSESVETLMSVLTCEEVVHLLEWEQVVSSGGASHKWLYPGLLEAVSVAHIVHGFVCRQPAYIKMGLGLVQQLPSTPDLCVVEGVSHVLLGAVNQAAEALKQAERPGKGAAADRPAPAPLDVTNGALPASRDAYRFVVAGSAGSDDGLLPGLCMLTERWLTQAAFPFFRDTSGSSQPSASLVKYFDDTRVETLLTVYDAKSGGQLAETLSEAFTSIKRGLRKAAAQGLLATGAAVAAGDAGDQTADAAAAARQRLFRLVGGGVAVLAALGAALLSPPGQKLLGRGDGTQAAAVLRQSAAIQPLTVAPEDFTPTVAKQLLERWQVAKAWALGAEHATEQLEVLLAEPLLGETLDKVATLKSHGAHMRFKLLRLQVLDVKRLPVKTHGAPAVLVSALVEDSADLHNDADGKPVNTCRRVFDAEYTVVQGRDGVWRMAGTTVVEREARKQ